MLSVVVWSFEWWGASVVICLERDADLHMAQLMPLPLAVSCFSKSRLGPLNEGVLYNAPPAYGPVYSVR